MTDAKELLPGLEERHGEVKGARLRYFVGGEGEPVVLVHGLGGAATNWTMMAPELARGHRVLVPDLPGHGGSPPLAAVPNLSVFGDRVALLAAQEGIEGATVVGHSMGGVVALRMALRHPDAVTRLVLAAPAGISSTTRRAEYSLRMVGLVQPGKLLAPFRRYVAESPRLRYLAFGTWSVADAAAFPPRAAAGFLAGPPLHTDTVSAARALVRDDVRTELGELECPRLVLWGARDRQLPLSDGFDFARRLRAPLRVIADCGHLLIAERPQACLDAIADFLGTPD